MKTLFIVLFSIITFCTQASVVVISDFDDTVKKANSKGGVIASSYHFLRKKVYLELRDLYQEIEKHYSAQGEEVEFFYVSAAPDFLFNQQKWIKKHHFPLGKTFLRKRGSGNTYEHKTSAIKEILKGRNANDTKVLFFGDNSNLDPKIYLDMKKFFKLQDAGIFIRDVSTDATSWSNLLPVNKFEGVHYFFSERELIGQDDFFFMSDALKKRIEDHYGRGDLVPDYTFKTLKKRLNKVRDCGCHLSCKRESKALAHKYWLDYYSRF